MDVYRIGWTTHRRWRTNVKHLALPHRPWQAEADGLQFCRRGFTKESAARRLERDVAYATGGVTGYPIDSPAQLRLRYLAHHPIRLWWRAKKDATYADPPAVPVSRTRTDTEETIDG